MEARDQGEWADCFCQRRLRGYKLSGIRALAAGTGAAALSRRARGELAGGGKSVHLLRPLPFRLALQMLDAVASGEVDAISLVTMRLIPLPLAEAAIGNHVRARSKVALKKRAVDAFVSSLGHSRDRASASPSSPERPRGTLSPVTHIERLRRGLFKRRDRST